MNNVEKILLLKEFNGRLLNHELSNVASAIIMELYQNDFIDINKHVITLKTRITGEYSFVNDIIDLLLMKKSYINANKLKLSIQKNDNTLELIQKFRDKLVKEGHIENSKEYIYKSNKDSINNIKMELKSLINSSEEKDICVLCYFRNYYYPLLNKEEKKLVNLKLKSTNYKFSSLININKFTSTFFIPIIFSTTISNDCCNTILDVLLISLTSIFLITAVLMSIYYAKNLYKKIDKNKH